MSRRRTILLLVVLGLSLAVNLFVGGRFVAHSLMPREDRVVRFAGVSAIGTAPDALRARVRSEIERDRASIRAAFRDVREGRRAVREAMRADPFDRQALDGALSELRRRSDLFQAAVHAAVVRAIAASPAEERVRIGGRRGGE